jgi:hypothetical protein
MNFADQMTESYLLGRLRPRPAVGTMGGAGWMKGPCACPGGSAIRSGVMLCEARPPRPGQAQGPLIRSPHPLVPTQDDAQPPHYRSWL